MGRRDAVWVVRRPKTTSSRLKDELGSFTPRTERVAGNGAAYIRDVKPFGLVEAHGNEERGWIKQACSEETGHCLDRCALGESLLQGRWSALQPQELRRARTPQHDQVPQQHPVIKVLDTDPLVSLGRLKTETHWNFPVGNETYINHENTSDGKTARLHQRCTSVWISYRGKCLDARWSCSNIHAGEFWGMERE